MMNRTVDRIAATGHTALLASALTAALGLSGCKTSETPAQAPPAPAAAVEKMAPADPLLNPAMAKEIAPAEYKVKMSTSKGDFVIEVHRDWGPVGADRFYNLVKIGYFREIAFFRVIKGFMVQFGIHGDPKMNQAWKSAHIPDDPPIRPGNTRGMVSFATAGPGTRTTQLFINYGDNSNLDSMGFVPIGKVASGMDVVDALEGIYGEGTPRGNGPDQGRLQAEGSTYLNASFPKMDYLKSAALVP